MTDPRADNLGYWCDRAARTSPDRICLFDLSRSPAREVSYAELVGRMDRVASLFTESGLTIGDRVAMAIGNRFEFIEIMYGAMRAGLVPVPLNIRQPAETLEYIVRDAACAGAVVEPAAAGHAVAACQDVGIRLSLGPPESGRGDGEDGLQGPDSGSELGDGARQAADFVPYEAALRAADPGFAPGSLPAGHSAFQPYTSGSTGRPKGVVLTHEGQLWWTRALETYWPADPNDRALAAVPLYHKNAMAGAIKPLLQAGASVVLLPDFEPRRFLRALSEYRCTSVGGVPAVFTLLLRHRELIEALDFSALRSVSIGSAPVPEELLAEIERAFGVEVSESYGLTEGGPVMLGSPLDGRVVPRGSCGVAWPEGEIRLVDEEGAEHPSDGELWVRNPGVTPGYHKLPAVNRARLRDGWLATGDLFHRDEEGFYYFRGRTDDMFNCGGENIYPKEVENLVLTHPGVADAAVLPVEHPVKGHVPLAMVVLNGACDVSPDDLVRFTLERGAAYAHARRVLIVDEMPLTGAGKPDREAIRRALEARFAEQIVRAAAR